VPRRCGGVSATRVGWAHPHRTSPQRAAGSPQAATRALRSPTLLSHPALPLRSPILAGLRVCAQAHELKVRKELLEACYDDEVADVERLLAEEVAHVDMADPHGNSLVSEAAAGGAINALRLTNVPPVRSTRSLHRRFTAPHCVVCTPNRPRELLRALTLY
jgi:hypothetical protein